MPSTIFFSPFPIYIRHHQLFASSDNDPISGALSWIFSSSFYFKLWFFTYEHVDSTFTINAATAHEKEEIGYHRVLLAKLTDYFTSVLLKMMVK